MVLFTQVTVSSLIPENPFWPLALQEVCEFSASSQTCAESKHKVRNSWASICTSQITNSSTRGKLLLWNPEASEEHSEEMFGTAEYGSVLAQRALKNPWVFLALCAQSGLNIWITGQICLSANSSASPKCKSSWRIAILTEWRMSSAHPRSTSTRERDGISTERSKQTTAAWPWTLVQFKLGKTLAVGKMRLWFLSTCFQNFLITAEEEDRKPEWTSGWWKLLHNQSCLTNQPNLMNLLYPLMPSVWPLKSCSWFTAEPTTEHSRLSVLC